MSKSLKFITNIIEIIGSFLLLVFIFSGLEILVTDGFGYRYSNLFSVIIIIFLSFICIGSSLFIKNKKEHKLYIGKPTKIFTIVVFLILLLGKLVNLSNKEDINKSIGNIIDEIQKDLPKNITRDCILTSVKFEENNIVFSYYYNVGAFNRKWYVDNPEKAKRLFATGLTNHTFKNFIEEITKNNIGIKFIANSINQEKWECSISHDYIENLLDLHKSNPEEFYKHNLGITIEKEKGVLPIEIEEGLSLIDIKYDGNNIVYIAKIDEDIYSMSDLKSFKNDIKEGIMSSFFEDEGSYILLSLCISSDSGIIYKLIGNKTLDSFDIIFFNFELRTEYYKYNINKPL